MIEIGDCREIMRRWVAEGVRAQMCVTSPPYCGLRDDGHPGQLGLESTPEEYVANMVEVFRLVRDVLADDGVLWLNLGSSYFGGGGRADFCGTSGKVPASYPARDCLCAGRRTCRMLICIAATECRYLTQ